MCCYSKNETTAKQKEPLLYVTKVEPTNGELMKGKETKTDKVFFFIYEENWMQEFTFCKANLKSK